MSRITRRGGIASRPATSVLRRASPIHCSCLNAFPAPPAPWRAGACAPTVRLACVDIWMPLQSRLDANRAVERLCSEEHAVSLGCRDGTPPFFGCRRTERAQETLLEETEPRIRIGDRD